MKVTDRQNSQQFRTTLVYSTTLNTYVVRWSRTGRNASSLYQKLQEIDEKLSCSMAREIPTRRSMSDQEIVHPPTGLYNRTDPRGPRRSRKAHKRKRGVRKRRRDGTSRGERTTLSNDPRRLANEE